MISHSMSNNEATRTTDGTTPPTDEVEALIGRVGEQIENGQLPVSILHNEAVYEQERRRIFGRNWVFVGHETEIPEPGDYRQRYIGTDPFIFVRDENSEIQVLFNSCRHRGSKVCRSEKGNSSHFRCPYHGWTYTTSGDLVGVPQQRNAYQHLDTADHGLHEAPHVESYHGLVFAALDSDVPSLEAYLGDATWYLDMYVKFIDMEVIGDPHRWEVETDWKTPAENFAGDNYHIPMGHKSAIDAGIGSDTATGEKQSDLYAIAEAGGHSFSLYQIESEEPSFWGHPPEVVDGFHPERLSDEQYEVARKSGVTLGTLFPNLSFIHLGGTNTPEKESVGTFVLRQWQPKGPGRMEVWNWILAPENASDAYKERVYESGMGTFSASGNFEVDDIAIWNGITEAAGSVFAEQHDTTTNFTMGRFGDAAPERVPDWPGPGEVYVHGGLTDENQLTFYRSWYDAMQEEPDR